MTFEGSYHDRLEAQKEKYETYIIGLVSTIWARL